MRSSGRPEAEVMSRLDQRGSALEYVLVTVLIGICAIFVLNRYGSALRGRVGSASSHVEQPGAAGEAARQAGGGGSSGGAPAHTASRGSELPPEEMGQLHTDSAPGEGVTVLGFRMDWKTALSLAALVIAIGVLMVRRISNALKKSPDQGAT